MRPVIVALMSALLLGCPGGDTASDSGNGSQGEQPQSPFGRFEGDVVSVWDPGGRNMTLREDFAYIDPADKRWDAKVGSVVNGASIPQPFWSLIGSPFEGKYRNASVVHDVACEQMTATWQAAHRMFYDACRCGGVGERKAKLMYWAVYNFGPRWNIVSETRVRTLPDGTTEEVVVSRPMIVAMSAPIDEQLPGKADEYFQNRDLSLDQIESLSADQILSGTSPGDPANP